MFELLSGKAQSLGDGRHLVGDVRWSPVGLTTYGPSVGTQVWDGSSWRPLFERRLIDADASGRAIFEEEDGNVRLVWEREGNTERLLSPRGSSAFGIGLLDDGRVVTWQPRSGSATATLTLYEQGRERRSVPAINADCNVRLLVGGVLACRSADEQLVAFDLSSGQHVVHDLGLPASAGQIVSLVLQSQ